MNIVQLERHNIHGESAPAKLTYCRARTKQTHHSQPPKKAMLIALRSSIEMAIATAFALLGYTFTQSQVISVLCFCVTGGAVFGCIGSFLANWLPGPGNGKLSETKRWIINSLGAIALGPFATWWIAEHWFPDAPVEFVAFATSGLIGTFFVSVICIIPAVVKNKFADKFAETPKPIIPAVKPATVRLWERRKD